MDTARFDNIRPYTDAEIPATMERIAHSEMFPLIASYVFPGEDVEAVRSRILSIKTIAQFQHRVMDVANEQVIRRSISRFTYSGLEHLDRGKSYLFVSNHRDIMLDASLLQHILHINGYETSEITFGANLMSLPLLIDIGRANKMFRVERAGSFKDFYRSSLLLSDYIRHTIADKHSSVWIAQRNGRTKDGIDRTEPGLISMFASSMPQDKIEALDSLRIVPVAVSYEWETCDVAKALELYESRFTRYVKKPGEDLNSILSGIVAQKGAVSIDICEPLRRDELMQYETMTRAEYVKAVAALIDSRINSAYHLFPNNYIAYDIRYGTNRYAEMYTESQRELFCARLRELEVYHDSEVDVIADIFLGIYANPVNSKTTDR
ncbi:MAG: 1-acyl-sn-glycerol-3-phosphate acyltransferase [Muribaculaceae bacterium]|nr:1-acyl-sn-glycerol-3-phosphate acyltransferase [Muribaculaceae bacterium]